MTISGRWTENNMKICIVSSWQNERKSHSHITYVILEVDGKADRAYKSSTPEIKCGTSQFYFSLKEVVILNNDIFQSI